MPQMIERINVYSQSALTGGAVDRADKLLMLQNQKNGLLGMVYAVLFRMRFTGEETDDGDATVAEIMNILSSLTIKTKNGGLIVNGIGGLDLMTNHLNSSSRALNFLFGVDDFASDDVSNDRDVVIPFILADGPLRGDWDNLEGALPLSEFAAGEINFQLAAHISADWDFDSSGCRVDIDLITGWSKNAVMPVFRRLVVDTEALPSVELETSRAYATRLRRLWIGAEDDSAFDPTGVTNMGLTIDGRPLLVSVNGADHQDMIRFMDTSYLCARQYLEETTLALPTIMEILHDREINTDNCPLIEDRAILSNANGAHSGNYKVGYLIQYRPDMNTETAMLREMGVSEDVIQRAKAEENDTTNRAVLWTGKVPSQVISPRSFRGTINAQLPTSW
jgi:hypothetical protein